MKKIKKENIFGVFWVKEGGITFSYDDKRDIFYISDKESGFSLPRELAEKFVEFMKELVK